REPRQAERARLRQRIGEDRPPRLVALAHAGEIERSYGAVKRLIVVVAVVVAGRAARGLPADPVRSVGPLLAFPDRHALLDAIDQEAPRAERFASMRRARRADDRRVADRELADPVVHGE